MSAPADRPDDGRAPAGASGRVAPRAGRVSALVVGSVVISAAGLITAVAWPALWWDVATNVNELPPRRVRTAPYKAPPPPPAPVVPELRSDPFEKPLADVHPPVARVVRRPLAGARHVAPGVAVTEVRVTGDVPTVPLPPAHIGLYAGVCWAPDGRSFFVLSSQGILLQASYPDLTQTRAADLGHACRHFVRSGAGLVAVLPSLQELWVFDPDTLAVSRRIGVAGVRRVLTAPELNFAYVLASNPDRGGSLPVRVDLTDGSQTGLTIRIGPTAVPVVGGFDFRAATVAPDGRSLFAMAGAGQLVRYQADARSLVLADATEPITRGAPGWVCISPDGRWVCLPSGDGHNGTDNGLHVYPADDLSRPSFTLQLGTGCYAVGFDPVGGRAYAENSDRPLVVFGLDGRAGPAIPPTHFPDGPHDVFSYHPHPDGRGLLVLTSDALFLVEFAAD